MGVLSSPTINGAVTVSHQNILNWISCNRVATGAVVCTYTAPDLLNLTTDMNCQTQIAANSFTNAYMVSVGNNNANGMTLRSSSGGAASDNIPYWISCVRTGSDDYQMKTIRQLIQDAGFVF